MKYFLFILFLSVAHATSNFDKTEFKLTETLDMSKHKLVKKYKSHRPVEYYLRHPRLYHGIKWDYINTKSALKRFHGVTNTHSIILECSHQYTHCEKWVGPKLEAKFRVQHVKPMLGCGGPDTGETTSDLCVYTGTQTKIYALVGGRDINQTKCEAPNSTWDGTACANPDYTNKLACETQGKWQEKFTRDRVICTTTVSCYQDQCYDDKMDISSGRCLNTNEQMEQINEFGFACSAYTSNCNASALQIQASIDGTI